MNNIVNLPAPADKIVCEFVDKICSIKPDFIEGIYLTGSIALNDFYSNKSDIDFLVLCKELPGESITSQLKRHHKTIAARYSKPDLSGVYISSESIQAAEPENIKALHYHLGTMRYAGFEMAPETLAELKANAITVFGPKAESLPVKTSNDDLNEFLSANINAYWARWIKQHSSFFNRKFLLLLFPRLTEWVVLGVARQLCTLQTGKIVSKTEAGLCCLQYLPENFHPVIKQAIAIRKDNRSYPILKSYGINPSFKRVKQTIDCVNYIIASFNSVYNNSYKDPKQLLATTNK